MHCIILMGKRHLHHTQHIYNRPLALLAVFGKPVNPDIRFRHRRRCEHSCRSGIIALYRVGLGRIGLAARHLEGHIVISRVNDNPRLLQDLQRLAYNHFGFQVIQHNNFTVFLKQRCQEQKSAEILRADRTRYRNPPASRFAAANGNRKSSVVMLHLYAELAKRCNQIVMRTFAQRIRIRVHKGDLRTEGRHSHQKTQHRTGIAHVKLFDIPGMAAKALNDNFLLIFCKHCSQIGDTPADRIAVFAVRRVVDRADSFRQCGDQQVARSIIFGRQGSEFPLQGWCRPNNNVHDISSPYGLKYIYYVLLSLTG
ncbi:hypothetical protein D3C73_605580 [compost metagenome]